MSAVKFDRNLTKADVLVLQDLAADIYHFQRGEDKDNHNSKDRSLSTASTVATLAAMNDPKSSQFEPTIFNGTDLDTSRLPKALNKYLVRPYLSVARSIVRNETDIVMLNHLILYFSTSVPSAVYLFFYHFTWIHGLLHFVMQFSYMGTYTLMMHQHIHMRGILSKRFALIDTLFPYITDPLMGHTWNSYYYHHVKHHHIEGNGPDDLSSTLRYQRDNLLHFLHYVGRFFFFIWFDLPGYFMRKGQWTQAARVAFWELGWYFTLSQLYCWNPNATTCVFLMPLLLLRAGLMVGNWGQHAFVDQIEPDSDYRTSITLVDVASNRHCFNDGYHTSHHLNPRRHWREHPVSFLKNKDTYAAEDGLVFHNIDYIMITVRLMMKDYRTLAECMIPIGRKQLAMSLEDRMAFLKSHVRKFSEEEIQAKFNQKER